jgi:RNA polymerase-interacting CarD/CdnL/TRCF family regulator
VCDSHQDDESIYKQFLISLKTLIVKKEVMIPAFQSREFGLRVVVSEEQLKEVNQKQKNEK